MKKTYILAALLTAFSTSGAQAATVNWTDWTSAANGQVNGALTVGSSSVAVTYSGGYYVAQTNGGTNYWNPSAPYISAGVSNAPPGTDIIELGAGGLKTITFSEAVVDPLIALNSWNSNIVDFGTKIEVLSYGAGYWGNGTPVVNGAGTGFYGNGEVHGVIRLPGTFTSISFTDTGEYWHGITVGISGLASNDIPEPASLGLLGIGLAAARLASRRKAG